MQSLETAQAASLKSPLRDHRSLCFQLDDHLRICQIPKRKGANFRDLPGVTTWPDRKHFGVAALLDLSLSFGQYVCHSLRCHLGVEVGAMSVVLQSITQMTR